MSPSKLLWLALASLSLSACAARTVYVEATPATVAAQKKAQEQATQEELRKDETFQEMIRRINPQPTGPNDHFKERW